jgi:hypothetical protein
LNQLFYDRFSSYRRKPTLSLRRPHLLDAGRNAFQRDELVAQEIAVAGFIRIEVGRKPSLSLCKGLTEQVWLTQEIESAIFHSH